MSRSFFDKIPDQYQDALNGLQQAIRTYQKLVPDKRYALFWQMSLDYGKQVLQLDRDWVCRCAKLLKEMEE